MSDRDGFSGEEGTVNEDVDDYYSDDEVDRLGRVRKVRGLDTSIRGSFRRDCIIFIGFVIIILVIVALFLSA